MTSTKFSLAVCLLLYVTLTVVMETSGVAGALECYTCKTGDPSCKDGDKKVLDKNADRKKTCAEGFKCYELHWTLPAQNGVERDCTQAAEKVDPCTNLEKAKKDLKATDVSCKSCTKALCNDARHLTASLVLVISSLTLLVKCVM